jgi:hypothetical protein
LKQHVLRRPWLARVLTPLNSVGRRAFGDTRDVIRSGNWYGNDTLWRMTIDLNKILFYANPDGTMRAPHDGARKRFIGIVDAIRAGEGNGPLAPDPIEMHYLVWGANPVAIDAACATLMGFDAARIPTIARAFASARYPLARFALEDVTVLLDGIERALHEIPTTSIVSCKPHFGWAGHIERTSDGELACG